MMRTFECYLGTVTTFLTDMSGNEHKVQSDALLDIDSDREITCVSGVEAARGAVGSALRELLSYAERYGASVVSKNGNIHAFLTGTVDNEDVSVVFVTNASYVIRRTTGRQTDMLSTSSVTSDAAKVMMRAEPQSGYAYDTSTSVSKLNRSILKKAVFHALDNWLAPGEYDGGELVALYIDYKNGIDEVRGGDIRKLANHITDAIMDGSIPYDDLPDHFKEKLEQ